MFGLSRDVMISFFLLPVDSETTEDEATEPQIRMETKERPEGPQDQASQRLPAGKLYQSLKNHNLLPD